MHHLASSMATGIDPSSSNLRTPPRKADDLIVEACCNWLVSFNNVSGLNYDMHDELCCVSTGSGFATRKYYTNTQQVVVNIARPVVMNSIYNFIRRPDLLDRAIVLELPSIDESRRKTDSQLHKAVQANRSIIFRGLLDLLAKVLEVLPNVKLDKKTRMADFALLGTAVEQVLGLPQNTFMNRYMGNRAGAREGVLESSPVIMALIDYIEKEEFWRGRPSDLLEKLTKFKNPSLHTIWPKSAHAMASDLRRYMDALLRADIKIIRELDDNGKKIKTGNFYRISKIVETEKTSPSSPQQNENQNNGCRLYQSDPVHSVGITVTKPIQSPLSKTKRDTISTKCSEDNVDLVDMVDLKIKCGT